MNQPEVGIVQTARWSSKTQDNAAMGNGGNCLMTEKGSEREKELRLDVEGRVRDMVRLFAPGMCGGSCGVLLSVLSDASSFSLLSSVGGGARDTWCASWSPCCWEGCGW